MNAVFTICAKNYLPRARTLGDSIRRLHPDLAFHVFLVDEPDGRVEPAQERFHTTTVSSIAIPHFRQMAFKYNVLELSCAVKPYCFQHLFREHGYDRLIYFDPDVFVYSGLEVVFSLLDDAFLVLTPHLTKLEDAASSATPLNSFLFVGAYNLGFAAVRNCEKSKAFVSWWADRLADDGFADHLDAQHVDQKWMDLAPGLLGDDLVISRDPGLNAAQWNMHERRLATELGRYLMDGRPLGFLPPHVVRPASPGAARAAPEQVHVGEQTRVRADDEGVCGGTARKRVRGVLVLAVFLRVLRQRHEDLPLPAPAVPAAPGPARR